MFDIDPVLFENYKKSVDLDLLPKQFRKEFEAYDAADKKLWYEGRFKCLKYHLYLAGHTAAIKEGQPDPTAPPIPILGMDFQDNPHSQLFSRFVQCRPGEGLVLSALQDLTKKMMILWPRGHFKTSAVRVDIIQKILNYPNIRICFLTGGTPLAKRQLKTIKGFFEQPTKRFKWLFPEFCMRSIRNPKIQDELDPRAWTDVQCKLGTAYEFTVPCRTNTVLVEPTFAISTARSVKAGSHFDLIYIDDLVNETNYRKVDALEKCFQDYVDICPVLDPFGFMVVTGTRYSFGDTYERIQDSAKEEMQKLGQTIWKFSIRDCWSHGCQNCVHTDVYHDYDVNILQPPCKLCVCPGFKNRGNKDVLFPRGLAADGRAIGYTLEMLEGEKIRVGPEFFANQYENQPIAEGTQTFTETLIGAQTIHDKLVLPPYAQSLTFVVGDLAYVGQEGRDYSVLFVCRKFQGRLYIIDCFFGNWDSSQVAENTVKVILKYRPQVLYYEKFNGWEAYNTNITAYAKMHGLLQVPIQWVKGSQALNAKMTRIGGVKGPLKNRRLWIYANLPNGAYDMLVKQLVKWPKLGRHDDFADCCGMVVAAPTGYEQETPPEEIPQDPVSWLARLNEVRIEDDSYGDSGCGSGICC